MGQSGARRGGRADHGGTGRRRRAFPTATSATSTARSASTRWPAPSDLRASLATAFAFGLALTAGIVGSFYALARQWLAPTVAAVCAAMVMAIGFSGTAFNFDPAALQLGDGRPALPDSRAAGALPPPALAGGPGDRRRRPHPARVLRRRRPRRGRLAARPACGCAAVARRCSPTACGSACRRWRSRSSSWVPSPPRRASTPALGEPLAGRLHPRRRLPLAGRLGAADRGKRLLDPGPGCSSTRGCSARSTWAVLIWRRRDGACAPAGAAAAARRCCSRLALLDGAAALARRLRRRSGSGRAGGRHLTLGMTWLPALAIGRGAGHGASRSGAAAARRSGAAGPTTPPWSRWRCCSGCAPTTPSTARAPTPPITRRRWS